MDLISKKEAQQAIESVLIHYGYLPELQKEKFMAYDILHALDSVEPKTDDILSYIDRIDNSGMGKKKCLEYLRKYVEKNDGNH